MGSQEFQRRLYDEWLPAFCSDSKRRHSTSGFKGESIKVSEFDAANFMRALDSGLVRDTGGGRFRSAKSGAFEQIFWTGPKAIEPRPLTLWIEPIITIGTIARLGLDYGWASELLGMQCHDWAFDFAVFETRTASSERIAGEVKKTQKELDLLIDELREFGRLGLTDLPPDESKRLNSFKKWQALLNRRAPLFWAVGPDDYTHAFEVQYEDDLKATFSRVDLDALKPRIDVSIPT